DFGVQGKIRYQLCSNVSCLPPQTVTFHLGRWAEQEKAPPERPSLGPPRGPRGHAVEGAAVEDAGESAGADSLANLQIEVAEDTSDESLLVYLVYAFLGGMILNVMPCVLPVLAIKV